MSKRNRTARNPSQHADLRYEIEILLPVYYNDGREVEFEKLDATFEELFGKFHGLRWTPQNPPPYAGLWQSEGQTYTDLVRTFLIETTHDNNVFRWLHSYKRKLETRFDQIEIYITATEILRVL